MTALLFLLATHALPSAALAETVELDINGDKETKYAKHVSKLEEGDTVVFKNGERFKLGKYLGTGSENRVFALDKEHVIRIPNRAEVALAAQETTHGAPSLVALGVPAVKVEGAPLPTKGKYHEMEYAIAERIKPRFTLDDFFLGRGEAAHLSKSEEKKILKLLVDYARKTALFTYLDSAGPDQIIFTQDDKLVLADWKGHHQPIEPKNYKSLKSFLAADNPFTVIFKTAPGNLTQQQLRANRMHFDEWDTTERYLSFNENPRWLAVKDDMKAAIDDERRAVWEKYDGDLDAALKAIGKKNLAKYVAMNYRLRGDCFGSIKEILRAVRED